MVSRSFVIVVVSILVIAGLLFAVINNPSAEEHRAEIRAATAGSLATGVYHSLKFVSYTKIGGQVASIGLLGIVFVSPVALIQVQLALAISALLIGTGIFLVAAKKVHLVMAFLDRSASTLKHLSDRATRDVRRQIVPRGIADNIWDSRFPFALGIVIPIVVSDWSVRMLDFGNLLLSPGPAAGGLVFSVATILATMRSRLRPFLVALTIFAGVPIGCVIDAGIQGSTLVPEGKTILTQVVYWWVIGVVPALLGVGFGAASRKDLSESR